jgi:DNA-3-methyladenine glycosylase I
MNRCGWVGNDPLYVQYHDKEWGIPVHDDTKQFEFLILEGAQAGLSWLTVLKKRENYREALQGFNPYLVARMTENEIERVLRNPGIIRNKLKVKSAVKNAQVFLEIKKEFGSFSDYIWSFVQNKTIVNSWKDISEVPTMSKESDRLSKDLKRRGMSFVGSTIMYAHMQAMGLVNDHTLDCFKHNELR